MWFSVVMLLVFASLHDGVKSDLLSDRVQEFVSKPGIGDTQATKLDTATSIQKEATGDLTLIHSAKGPIHSIIPEHTLVNERPTPLRRRRRGSAAAAAAAAAASGSGSSAAAASAAAAASK